MVLNGQTFFLFVVVHLSVVALLIEHEIVDQIHLVVEHILRHKLIVAHHALGHARK